MAANKRTKHAALDKKRSAAKDSAKKNRSAAARSKNRDLQDNLDQQLQSIHVVGPIFSYLYAKVKIIQMHSFVDNAPVEPPTDAFAADEMCHIAQLAGRLGGL